jgi:hypothetical protein
VLLSCLLLVLQALLWALVLWALVGGWQCWVGSS